MSIKWLPGDYDGHSRPWLVLRRFKSTGERPEYCTVVERLLPTARGLVEAALMLFLAGVILGAGMLLGAALISRAVAV